MYGVVDGVYYCNIDRDEELNKRIAARNNPGGPLQPQFSLRPVSTKYALLPVLDRRPKPKVVLESYPNYTVEGNFNPTLSGSEIFGVKQI